MIPGATNPPLLMGGVSAPGFSILGQVGTNNSPSSIAIDGDTVYICCDAANTVQSIDVIDKAAPAILDSQSVAPYYAPFRDIAVIGSHALIVDALSTTNDFIKIQTVDISNPSALSIVASKLVATDPNNLSQRIRVAGTVACGLQVEGVPVLGVRSGVLTIYDATDPTMLVVSGTLHFSHLQFCASVAIDGTYCYVVTTNPTTLKVVDISNPAVPVVVGSVALSANNGQPENASVTIDGTHAYIANNASDDLQIVDISVPAAPVVVGSIGFTNRPTDVCVIGTTAYVCVAARPLQAVDVSDPTTPVVADTLALGSGGSYSIATDGSFLYVVSADDDIFYIVNPL